MSRKKAFPTLRDAAMAYWRKHGASVLTEHLFEEWKFAHIIWPARMEWIREFGESRKRGRR